MKEVSCCGAVYHFGPKWGIKKTRQLVNVSPSEARHLLVTAPLTHEEKTRVAAQLETVERNAVAERLRPEWALHGIGSGGSTGSIAVPVLVDQPFT